MIQLLGWSHVLSFGLMGLSCGFDFPVFISGGSAFGSGGRFFGSGGRVFGSGGLVFLEHVDHLLSLFGSSLPFLPSFCHGRPQWSGLVASYCVSHSV